RPPLALLAAACAVLAYGPSASAATVSADPVRGKRAADHRCACPSCRGQSSCCCSSRDPVKGPPSRGPSHPPPSTPAAPAPGPCIASAPCGGDGLPVSAPDSQGIKVAALAGAITPSPAPGCRPSALPPASLLPALPDDPLADPPEPRGDA